MRLVTALLLAAVPVYAAAQSVPAKPPVAAPDVPAKPPVANVHPKPTVAAVHPKPPVAAGPAKPPPRPAVAVVGSKPASRPAAPGKPTARPPAKPGKPAPKPTVAKPGLAKPGATKPAPVVPPPETQAPVDAPRGSNTGLPLPRFAALKSDDVNFRRGPGTRYPIEWVYKRRDLPVEIEREFEVWRLVTDPDGSKGWVQAATLTGRRTAIVMGAERTLRQSASDTAGPVAKLDKGVIVRLRTCEAQSEWCQVQVNDYRGYLKRTEIWGIQAKEAIP